MASHKHHESAVQAGSYQAATLAITAQTRQKQLSRVHWNVLNVSHMAVLSILSGMQLCHWEAAIDDTFCKQLSCKPNTHNLSGNVGWRAAQEVCEMAAGAACRCHWQPHQQLPAIAPAWQWPGTAASWQPCSGSCREAGAEPGDSEGARAQHVHAGALQLRRTCLRPAARHAASHCALSPLV